MTDRVRAAWERFMAKNQALLRELANDLGIPSSRPPVPAPDPGPARTRDQLREVVRSRLRKAGVRR